MIGFMGCGKTSAGKKISKKLNLGFIDLDEYIETKTDRTIEEIFEVDGEEVFRQIESNCLKELTNLDNLLIACGGGTPCYYNNMGIIVKSGFSIYLKMDPMSLANRLMNSKTVRPLIRGKTKPELISYITEKLLERERYYLKSNTIVPGLNPDINNIIDKIRLNFNIKD